MAKDKLISPSFCYILAANFLLFFAFYLILPILPFYLQDQFDADKSMIGFILSCYTIAALCIARHRHHAEGEAVQDTEHDEDAQQAGDHISGEDDHEDGVG